MIHILERNIDFGLQVMRTGDLQQASAFILEGGFPEANDAVQDMEALYYENLNADIYVVIDTRDETFDYEVLAF